MQSPFVAEFCNAVLGTRHNEMFPQNESFFQLFCCHGNRKSHEEDNKNSASSWKIFTFKELLSATNNFSEDKKLGEGGFGCVYWGQLQDNSQIAVKRLKNLTTTNEMAFAVEVETLGRVQHKNLLKLRGYCTEGQERIIVYDYMPNLSLLSHLHGRHGAKNCLSWPKRVRIAMGSAEAIEYLHHHATPHIIHRDVKASNVLIDENFEAQIADFGFAKFVPEGVTHMTTRVKGTLGYLAPEYAMWGKVSDSCDVYSFGILLLEIISGKKPIEKMGPGMKRTIVEWAAPLVFQGKFEDLVDPRLQGKFSMLQLKKLVHAATLCAQSSPENRPTMREVVTILKDKRLDNSISMSGSFKMETVKYRQELLTADEED